MAEDVCGRRLGNARVLEHGRDRLPYRVEDAVSAEAEASKHPFLDSLPSDEERVRAGPLRAARRASIAVQADDGVRAWRGLPCEGPR